MSTRMRFAEVFRILVMVYICSCRGQDESSGSRQSPVNIDTSSVEKLEGGCQQPLTMNYTYPRQSSVTAYNDGYTVNFVPDEKGGFTMCGGPLVSCYVFSSLHYHWGPNDSVGSEHTINNKSYSMEAHGVFYNTKYSSLSEALNQADGLAVIGIFLQGGYRRSNDFQPVSNTVQAVGESGNQTTSASEAYDWFIKFIELHCSNYFTYPGSLTTPEFNENVQWIVFNCKKKICSKQIKPFRKLKDRMGRNIKANYRDTQPLNGRTILHSPCYTINQ